MQHQRHCINRYPPMKIENFEYFWGNGIDTRKLQRYPSQSYWRKIYLTSKLQLVFDFQSKFFIDINIHLSLLLERSSNRQIVIYSQIRISQGLQQAVSASVCAIL